MAAMSARRIPEHLFICIDHVGIAVPDLDEAIAFYRDAFGMGSRHQETNEEQGVREAMVAVGDSGSCIQLLAPLDETSDDREVPRPLRARACSSWPTGSPTSSRSRAVLRERGLRLLYDEPRRGTAGSRINFMHPKDAGGVLVELVEPARGTELAAHGAATQRNRTRCPGRTWAARSTSASTTTATTG